MCGEECQCPIPLTLRSELSSFADDSVEVAESKQNTLKLILPSAHLHGILVKVIQGLVKVSLHAGRRFVGDLDSRLKNTLKKDSLREH